MLREFDEGHKICVSLRRSPPRRACDMVKISEEETARREAQRAKQKEALRLQAQRVAEGKKPVDKAESSQRRRANRRKRKKNAAEAATRRSTRKVDNLPSWMKDMTKKEKLAKKEAALAATE